MLLFSRVAIAGMVSSKNVIVIVGLAMFNIVPSGGLNTGRRMVYCIG